MLFFVLLILTFNNCSDDTEINYFSAKVNENKWHYDLTREEDFMLINDHLIVNTVKQSNSSFEKISFHLYPFAGVGRYYFAVSRVNLFLYQKGPTNDKSVFYYSHPNRSFIDITYYDEKVCKAKFEGFFSFSSDSVRVADGSFRIEYTPGVIVE